MTKAECEDAAEVAHKKRRAAQHALRRAEWLALRAKPRDAALAVGTMRAARRALAHAWRDERAWARIVRRMQ